MGWVLKSVMSVGASCALLGCGLINVKSMDHTCAKENSESAECGKTLLEGSALPLTPKPEEQLNHYVVLSDYTKQLALLLYQDTQASEFEGPIAVMPFDSSSTQPKFDRDYSEHMARYLSGDMRDLGLSTSYAHIPTKLSGAQLDTRYLSKAQVSELHSSGANYALFGSIQDTSAGLVLHANIINIKSNALMASAQKLIPRKVLENL